MSKFTSKIASVGLTAITVVSLSGFAVLPAAAATSTDVQAQITALLAQIASLQSQLGTTGTSTSGTAYTFTRSLTVGSKGDDVTALQNYLKSTGNFTGTATGYFGSITKAAVAAWQTANGVSPAAGYFGTISRAKYTSVAGTTTTTSTTTTTTTTTTATGAPLSVALASNTPTGGNIVLGSANNIVTNVVFTAASAADTNISAMTVKSFGTAALGSTDISLVKILDASGTQQGLSQTMVQGQANFVFTPAINIPKGTSKTLSIAVDMAVGGAPTATVKMGIELATKITGATFTGTFPVVGNPYTEIAGGALGTVNVAAGAIVPANTVYIGTAGAVLGNFTVSAGTNEDITITQFNVNRDSALSTVQDSDISNVRVLVAGVQNGNPTTFSSLRATINLATPVVIAKGTSATFQVVGDIASGGGRTITLQANTSAVVGSGNTSHSGVAGPAANLSLAAANTITIQAGVVSVSVSTASPQGGAASIVISSTPQILGVYDLRAGGEDLLLTDVGAELLGTNAGAGTIGSFGIYDQNGALLSNQVTLVTTDWDATPNAQHFTLNTTIPAGTVKQLVFKGVTNLVTTGDNVSVVLVNGGGGMLPANRAIVSTGMSSSGQAGANNITLASALALPPITLNLTGSFGTAGVLTGDTTTNKYDQAFLGPVSQAITGTIKVTANNEDQRLRDLILTGVPVGFANMAAAVSTVALYDGSTQITNFVAPAANTVTYAAADILVPTTFVKNTPKVLTIVANTLAPTVAHQLAGASYYWTVAAVANNFETTGATSGALAQHSGATASNFRTNVGAYNEGGTYVSRSNVLEVSKSANSPSGTVARGTFATVASYDLNSKGANQNLGLSAITFTSTLGLPSALTSSVAATGVLNDAALFRLYDVDNGIAVPAVGFLNVANGTIAFSGITAAAFPAVVYGQTRHLALQITTTNQALWAAGTSMLWTAQPTAAAVMPVVVGQMGSTIAATDTDFGGTAVTSTSIQVETNPAGGAGTFVPATDGLYWTTANHATVTAGDIRLWIGSTAARGAGYLVNSIVKAGDTDAGQNIATSTSNRVEGDIAAYVYGTNALYYTTVNHANTIAGDVRMAAGGTVATGLNWQAGVGFGGANYSIPASANTVSL